MKTLKTAKEFIEFSSLSLEGKDDFVPFIIVTDDRDREFFVGFAEMPTDPEAKDQIADLIMALCVVHGAVEVAFGSAAWSAETPVDDDSDAPPSERSNRKEVAIVSAANAAGVRDVRIASVVRENGKVGIGLWEQIPPTAMTGRFAEALHMGIKLSAKIPPEIRAYLREQTEAGLIQEIVTSTAHIINEARRTAMTIETMEKRMWEK
jgi:hypothetical protein